MTSANTRMLATVGVLATIVGYLVVSVQSDDRPDASGSAVWHPADPPFVIFRTLAPSDAYGRVALIGLQPAAERRVTRLSCLRLHYAGGSGLCARQEIAADAVLNVVYVFDETLEPRRRIVLEGVPTRLRVAPDGRVGAITTYAEEESPQGERLTTRTRIIEMRSGRQVADLREFRVDNPDFATIRGPIDVASVAFERDGDRFFASLWTDTERYLVAGSIVERRLTTIRAGMTSEALSPDGRQLVVKRLIPERGFWQLGVIDLSTWAERDLRQGPRSVDDQVEWLDNQRVLYHDVDGESTSLWVLAADGIGGPRVLIKDAYSGAVQR